MARLAASRKPGAEIRTSTTTFPIPELSKVIAEIVAVLLLELMVNRLSLL